MGCQWTTTTSKNPEVRDALAASGSHVGGNASYYKLQYSQVVPKNSVCTSSLQRIDRHVWAQQANTLANWVARSIEDKK